MAEIAPVSIITGASSGIGEALAVLEARTHRVVLVARREERLKQVVARIQEQGGEAVAIAGDVSKIADCQKVIKEAVSRYGRIDRMIANAGIAESVFIEDFSSETFDHVMKINFYGLLYMVEAALPHFLTQKRGHIVAISSIAAFVSVPGSSAYHCSKASMVGLMHSLRRDCLGKGIKTTIICPGFIETDMTARNNFRMPLLMPLDVAVKKIYRAIEHEKALLVFPKRSYWLLKMMQCLPLAWQDRILTRPGIRYVKNEQMT